MLSKWTAVAAAFVIASTMVFWIVTEVDRRNAPTIEISAPRNGEPIVVEIAGAVHQPGVYELPARARIDDAIEAAGGLLPAADTSGINQASLLIDGQRITIPATDPDSNAPLAVVVASPDAILVIDINRATVDDFDTLPGIGETKANAIVQYRNLYGPFTSIEELLLVEGIGEALLEDIRPYVTVSS